MPDKPKSRIKITPQDESIVSEAMVAFSTDWRYLEAILLAAHTRRGVKKPGDDD